MKTLLLAAALFAAGAPVMAHDWNNGPSSGYRGTNYHSESSRQNYGGPGYLNGSFSGGYGSNFNHNSSDSRGYPTRGPTSYHAIAPVLPTRGTYDPQHGDFHRNVNSGYGTILNQPGFNPGQRGYDDHIRY